MTETYVETPGMITRMLAAFIRTNSDRPAVIRQLAAAQDLEQLGIQAHSLKSAFGFLKADEMMAFAREIELAAKQGNIKAFEQAERLASDIEFLLAEVESYQKTMPA